MPGFEWSRLAIPSVLLLITFLAYTSQYLLLYLEPGPLERDQSVKFNILLGCLLVSYFRSCYTNPGFIPADWDDADPLAQDGKDVVLNESRSGKKRWCRKCQMVKPARAHHCKICKRCIPKMDHHCPWTSNCVSHRTYPHFVRFLLYAVASMSYLEYFLYLRGAVIWENRHMPSYHGPSVVQIAHLFILFAVNTLTLFMLGILLIRTLWCVGANTTTIEGWEIERHETLVRRSRVFGGYLQTPEGQRMRIARQEFPYDIGIWQNFKQGMGTGNLLAWFWPLSASPTLKSGLRFEENGFEDPSLSWPPPDPDRIPFIRKPVPSGEDGFLDRREIVDDNQLRIAAFRQRQQADIQRRKPFHRRFSDSDGGRGDAADEDTASDGGGSEGHEEEETTSETGEEGWRNSEGERLRDFGVDEDVEFYDEDELPLAELIRLRKLQKSV